MDWQLVVSVLTLALVIFTIIWGTGLWARIERVDIKTSGVTYKMKNDELIEFMISDLEVQRTGREQRYLSRIILRFSDKHYSQLSRYIDFRNERDLVLDDHHVRIPNHGREKISWPHFEWRILNSTEWRLVKEELQEELKVAIFKVGLVWEDNTKIYWITVKKDDYGKWVRV